ncbi:hypothetical protein [Myroides indicus]|uniref:Uncharacterized protein n=1 Tax=Myroides indicus TaxID=1323422 RepID=A0A4R7ER24_9FLAO|nr:hypothetical protein [Myroides indicus]TDS53337.1 hypothetical protein C8P70_12832 [Myroides indicus]
MVITQISKANIKPDYWNGGKTFQYFIYPIRAQYSAKDFDFRISVVQL